jgi:hypothetical protein
LLGLKRILQQRTCQGIAALSQSLHLEPDIELLIFAMIVTLCHFLSFLPDFTVDSPFRFKKLVFTVLKRNCERTVNGFQGIDSSVNG